MNDNDVEKKDNIIPDGIEYAPDKKKKEKFIMSSIQRKQNRKFLWIYIIVVVLFLSYCSIDLIHDKYSENQYWKSSLSTSKDVALEAAKYDKNATRVKVGTKIEDIRDFKVSNSTFEATGSIWFTWKGNKNLDIVHHFGFYKGDIKNLTVDVTRDYGNNMHYQQADFDVIISKVYWTKRFPLESHQLRLYVMPDYTVGKVLFENDAKNSVVNRNIAINGFKIDKSTTATCLYKFGTTYGIPGIKDHAISSEHVTEIEINREGIGLYLICFISMIGTLLWALISLYICTYHRVDPLSMIPGALFGAVANIMVGANRLANLQSGLLLYVNIFGIGTILTISLCIVTINRIRQHYEDRAYAAYFGTKMFRVITAFTIVGNILLPISAYKFF